MYGLEEKYHDSRWTIEEDALAFLTDAALVGRLTMDYVKRWPKEQEQEDTLEHKISECIWWLIVLSDRMDIDIKKVLNNFYLKKRTI